jgi:hypothetical protein
VLEGFSKFENLKIKYKNEDCDTNTSLDACKTKCNYNRDCTSFTYNPEEQKCCLSTGTEDINYNQKLITFVKTLPKYDTVTLGDRFGGNLGNATNTDLEGCADNCDKDYKCVGFSFKKDNCLLKKADGLGSRYSETGYQFYQRKDVPTGPDLPKVRYVRLTFDNNGGQDRYLALNIHELRVLNRTGQNIALNKTAKSSSYWDGNTKASKAFDGSDTSYFHSAHDTTVDWVEVDLGSDQEIAKVEVWNVFSNSSYAGVKVKDRLKVGGARVTLKASNGSTITTPKIKFTSAKYAINFNNPTPNWE